MTVRRWHAALAATAWSAAAAGLVELGDAGHLTLPGSAASAGTWFETVGPVIVAMSLIRVLAILGSAWLAAATLMQLVASLRVGEAWRRAADRVSPRWLRDLGRSMATVSLSASLAVSAMGPSLAAPRLQSAIQQDDDGAPEETTGSATGPGVAVMRPLPDTGPEIGPAARPPAPTPQPAREPAEPPSYTVEPGDSCWSIAEELLAELRGGVPPERETAELWRRLIDLNHGRFATGDPNLLFPGQTLLLPPVG